MQPEINAKARTKRGRDGTYAFSRRYEPGIEVTVTEINGRWIRVQAAGIPFDQTCYAEDLEFGGAMEGA
jgi:hypothetical protein